MFQTPSAAVEETRLWPFLSLGTSFSVGSGALSSIDKPAMAESTLVSGTDMMDRWMDDEGRWKGRGEEKREREGREQVTTFPRPSQGCHPRMRGFDTPWK